MSMTMWNYSSKSFEHTSQSLRPWKWQHLGSHLTNMRAFSLNAHRGLVDWFWIYHQRLLNNWLKQGINGTLSTNCSHSTKKEKKRLETIYIFLVFRFRNSCELYVFVCVCGSAIVPASLLPLFHYSSVQGRCGPALVSPTQAEQHDIIWWTRRETR